VAHAVMMVIVGRPRACDRGTEPDRLADPRSASISEAAVGAGQGTANSVSRRCVSPVVKLVALALALVVSSSAYAEPNHIDCENHDQLPNLREDQILSCRDGENARIRAAARRFCARATGHQRSLCRQARPLLGRCLCAVELHRAGDDGNGKPVAPYAWLGGDPSGHEWYWGVELVVAKQGWRVTELFYDDYERP
jgi:hypothetical protein